MKLLVTGGGTGGHVYPALSIVDALPADMPLAVAWVGRRGGIEERIVGRRGLVFYPVATGAVRGANPMALVRSLVALMRGLRQALQLVTEFQPDIVLATGGYVSVPLTWAAHAKHVPTLLYLPDMEPGWAARLLSLFVERVAVSFVEVARHFPRHKVMVTGYPVRGALYGTSPSTARAALELTDGMPTLLVLGGSVGAHSINEAVRRNLEPLLQVAQVVHISGSGDYEDLLALHAQLPEGLRSRYHLFSYLDEKMADALVAADLAVARAGAATLGEFPAVGLPAVLVPYPYSGQHQWRNARYLEDRGAAIVVSDEQLASRLRPVLMDLLSAPERIARMRAAARQLATPQAAKLIGDQLVALAERTLRGAQSG